MNWGLVWTAETCEQGAVFSMCTNIDCCRGLAGQARGARLEYVPQAVTLFGELLMREHSRPDMSGHVQGSSYGMPGAVDGVSGHIVQHIRTLGRVILCCFLKKFLKM